MALEYAQELVEMDEENPLSYKNRGLAYANLQQFDKATKDWQKYVQSYQGKPTSYKKLKKSALDIDALSRKLGTVYYTKHPIVASLEWGEN